MSGSNQAEHFDQTLEGSGGLDLSPERKAVLLPRLKLLLDDLDKMRELESPHSEPAGFWPWRLDVSDGE